MALHRDARRGQGPRRPGTRRLAAASGSASVSKPRPLASCSKSQAPGDKLQVASRGLAVASSAARVELALTKYLGGPHCAVLAGENTATKVWLFCELALLSSGSLGALPF